MLNTYFLQVSNILNFNHFHMLLTSKYLFRSKTIKTIKYISFAFGGNVLLTSGYMFPRNVLTLTDKEVIWRKKTFICFCRQGASQLPDGGLAQLRSGHCPQIIFSLPSSPFLLFLPLPSNPPLSFHCPHLSPFLLYLLFPHISPFLTNLPLSSNPLLLLLSCISFIALISLPFPFCYVPYYPVGNPISSI